MPYNFKPFDRLQTYLLPPSLADWLPEGHLAWFIIDVVEQMDLAPFYARYRADGIGNSAFHPKVMLTLLIYAYCEGVRSSRKIESLCQRDVAYRVISANQYPDHSTISRFRKDNEQPLKKVFLEVLALCAAAGLVKLGLVSLDGSKLKANASLSANRTLTRLNREVEKMFSEAARKDTAEDRKFGSDRHGDEPPAGLRTRPQRLERLRACQARLKLEAARDQVARQARREEKRRAAEAAGHRLRGRKPKEPDKARDRERRANLTDPDSRIMKSEAGYVQGYNVQLAVTEDQIIIAQDVTQQGNDQYQLHPMLAQVEANRRTLGLPRAGVAIADAGYCNAENLARAPAGEPELYIATRNEHRLRRAMAARPLDREPSDAILTPVQLMSRKLLTEKGRALYRKRGETVEPVIGQIKSARGCDRFMRRGLEPNRSEWSLLCATHNLLKLWRSGRVSWNRSGACAAIISA